MKLATQTNATTTNFQFNETRRMEIDPTASGIILDSLIRIYSNPYVAALREYTSNALDSHKEAGVTRPIEVSLPTGLSPVLVIEDFGTGLDREGLYKYGQFGFSTKRDDNEGIGGYGLGSKVGLAFSSQYTVQAVKNGKLNIAVIGRDEDGNPQMGLLEEQDTDQPNGVKIMIPTSETHKFSDAIRSLSFFSGFPLNSIRIDGKAPEYSVHNTDQFEKLENGLGWKRNKRANHNIGGFALIHGVRYMIDWAEVENDLGIANSRGFLSEVVIDIENGSVDIQRSRETLVYSKRTREVLKSKVTDLFKYYTNLYQQEIDTAETVREALNLRQKAQNFGFDHNYTWKGKEITFGQPAKKDKLRETNFTVASIEYGGNSASGYQATKELRGYDQLVSWYGKAIFTGKKTILVVESSDPTTVRNRTRHVESNAAVMYALDRHENRADDNDGTNMRDYTFYFTTAKAKRFDKWFLGAFAEVITAEEYMERVREIRKENAKVAAATRKANAGSASKDTKVKVINTNTRGGYPYEMKLADLDQSITWVLLQNDHDPLTNLLRGALTTKKGAYSHDSLVDVLNYLNKHHNLGFISINKTEKIKPIVDGLTNTIYAADLVKFIEDTARGMVQSTTEIQKRAILDHANNRGMWANRIPKDRIDLIEHKDTREWIRAMQEQGQSSVHKSFLTTIANRSIGLNIDMTVAKITSTIARCPGEQYKLLDHLYGWNADMGEVIRYINLVDADLGHI